MSVFSHVTAERPRRSVFDLSYSKKFTADFSYLYPVMFDEAVPGDFWKIGASSVIRANPLAAPVMHEIDATAHYFFVPTRIIDPNFEEALSGGVTGTSLLTFPRWTYIHTNMAQYPTLWDMLGMPTDISPAQYNSAPLTVFKPIVYPLAAYLCIHAEYYADENLYGASNAYCMSPNGGFYLQAFWNLYNAPYNVNIWNFWNQLRQRVWRKDYFTSALPFRQRGDSLSIPLTGYGHALHNNSAGPTPFWLPDDGVYRTVRGVLQPDIAGAPDTRVVDPVLYNAPSLGSTSQHGDLVLPKSQFDNNNVDLSSVGTFDVSDLRSLFQMQKWQERNARSGVRYTELLRAHFGVAPRDDRLDRPEYIGGCKIPIAITEVLKTSTTDSTSPQANMAGHGISVGGDFIGSYRVQEFGYIVGLLSIMPKPAYEDRMDRQWLRRDRFDMYWPEFAHLSEQAIFSGELRYSATAGDQAVFGFQGIYNEMRFKHDMVCGGMRQSRGSSPDVGFSFWHCARHWDISARPSLDISFLQTGFNEATGAKRILAVPSAPAFLVNWKNHVKAVRPLPYRADPGLIDHF
jgi:hypothetical protein